MRLKSLISDGKAKEAADEPEPHAERRAKVREFVSHSRSNLNRMRYDLYQSRDMPRGSGAIESSCRHLVAGQLKKSGCRWSMPGANGIMVIRCCIENHGVADLFGVEGCRLTAHIRAAPAAVRQY